MTHGRGGKNYYCVKVERSLSQRDGEILLHADRFEVMPDGSLWFWQIRACGTEHPSFIIAPAKWLIVFSAYELDGHAWMVEHWHGEVSCSCPEKPPGKPRNATVATERLRMTQKLRYAVLERDGFKCVSCGRGNDDGVSLHVDHIVSVKNGGKTELSNLRALCENCNHGKGAD